jgi:hypothetical protein
LYSWNFGFELVAESMPTDLNTHQKKIKAAMVPPLLITTSTFETKNLYFVQVFMYWHQPLKQ